MNPEVRQCIENCLNCHGVALQTADYIMMNKQQMMNDPSLMKAIAAVAEICQVHSNFLLMKSDFSGMVGEVTANICDQCASLCEKADTNDTQLKVLSEHCRLVVDSCGALGGFKQAAA